MKATVQYTWTDATTMEAEVSVLGRPPNEAIFLYKAINQLTLEQRRMLAEILILQGHEDNPTLHWFAVANVYKFGQV